VEVLAGVQGGVGEWVRGSKVLEVGHAVLRDVLPFLSNCILGHVMYGRAVPPPDSSGAVTMRGEKRSRVCGPCLMTVFEVSSVKN
jgi:hypothetical protein